MNYVYILKCADDTFYTGWTNNIDLRIKAHNEGKGAKYTRGRTPVELVYYEVLPTKSEALGHREFYIPYKYQDTQEAFEKKCRL